MAMIRLSLNALPNGGDDLDRAHAGDQPGGERRGGDDQHRIELQREAGDDDQDAGKDEIIGHRKILPSTGRGTARRSRVVEGAPSITRFARATSPYRGGFFRPHR